MISTGRSMWGASWLTRRWRHPHAGDGLVASQIAGRSMPARRDWQNSGPMSVFEVLSLLVSTLGTLGTVYIGIRQLRQGALATSAVPYPVGLGGPAYPPPAPP